MAMGRLSRGCENLPPGWSTRLAGLQAFPHSFTNRCFAFLLGPLALLAVLTLLRRNPFEALASGIEVAITEFRRLQIAAQDCILHRAQLHGQVVVVMEPFPQFFER